MSEGMITRGTSFGAIYNKCQIAIPKILHFCWFGGGNLPHKAMESIEKWKEKMPDYEIVRWDESNYDVNFCCFSRDAYRARRWAFVSDCARFKILYEHGGVYMDVGSNLVQSIDPLVKRGPFSGREWETKFVAPGLALCAETGNPLIKATLDSYEMMGFENSWEFMSQHTVNNMFAKVLYPLGYTNEEDAIWEGAGFTVYPSEFFCPKLTFGGFKTTKNTYATHMGSASWSPRYEQRRIFIINTLAPVTGDWVARKIARVASSISKMVDLEVESQK